MGTPGSSHMSRHNRELRILSVHGRGEGPLAVDGHDTLVKASKLEALTADHSDAKSLERSEGLGVCEELTGQVNNKSISRSLSKKEASSVKTPAHTCEKHTPFMIQCHDLSANESICLVCLFFFMFKAADPTHHFNQGGRGYWWTHAHCRLVIHIASRQASKQTIWINLECTRFYLR